MNDTDRIKIISAACAMAADARLVIEARGQELADLSDAVDRFERLLSEAEERGV